MTTTAELAASLEKRIDDVNKKRYLTESAGNVFTQHQELDKLERRFEKQTTEANLYTSDWAACFKLIHRVIDIESKRENSDTTNKFISVGTKEDIRASVTETESKLLQQSLICEDAEFYPDLKDDILKTGIISERTIAISRYLKKKGYQPAVLLVDEETQLIAINSMIRKMATLMDSEDKFNGYRKAIGYLEMEKFMTDEGLFIKGIQTMSKHSDNPTLKIIENTLVNIGSDS